MTYENPHWHQLLREAQRDEDRQSTARYSWAAITIVCGALLVVALSGSALTERMVLQPAGDVYAAASTGWPAPQEPAPGSAAETGNVVDMTY